MPLTKPTLIAATKKMTTQVARDRIGGFPTRIELLTGHLPPEDASRVVNDPGGGKAGGKIGGPELGVRSGEGRHDPHDERPRRTRAIGCPGNEHRGEASARNADQDSPYP